MTVRVEIDESSAVPPYEQVRGQLAQQINDNALSVGTRLPTVRALATELGVAANTVARAYRELEGAGLLETRGRGGTFVSAAGSSSRKRAWQAAENYAAKTNQLGIDQDEALRIVSSALEERYQRPVS